MNAEATTEPNPNWCPECDKENVCDRIVGPHTEFWGPTHIPVPIANIEHWTCRVCGMSYIIGTQDESITRQMADWLLANGHITPEQAAIYHKEAVSGS